jgi:hypothetical protein
MKRIPPIEIDRAFALAALADRINKGKYINMDSKRDNLKTNKEIMLSAVEGGYVITDEDYTRGQQFRDHFNGLLFKKITGNLNGFETSIAEVLGKDKVAYHQLGLIAALPVTYSRDVKKETIYESIIGSAGSSQHLSDTKKATEMVVKVLDFIELKLYNCFTVTAVTESGNLVGFYMKENPGIVGKEYVTIKARVKSRGQYKGNVPITYLNYVKFPSIKLKEEVCTS